ncbi:MAG: hypothetical protein ACTSRG_25130 [Candidatus Helarchaeota archaeon]
MRKTSIILISLIAGFSVIGLSPVITANAQRPTPHLNFLSLWARGLTMEISSYVPGSHYAFGILQNNIGFAWGAVLGGGVLPLGHAWYALLGLSKFVETLGSPYYYLSVSNIKSVGSIFPGVLEAYNDSAYESEELKNGICDTHLLGAGSNISEVKYYLYLASYGGVDVTQLSPQPSPFPNFEINSDFSDITYRWGINYTNVNVNIINGSIWSAWTPIDTGTFDYVAIDYELDFNSDGTYQLMQNLHFGDFTPSNVSVNGLGLSVIQFNFAQTASFDLSLNTQARNETGAIVSDPHNTTIFRTAKIYVGQTDVMTLDLATSKANYTLDGTTNYSVTATSVPWYTGVYQGHVVDGTYDHNLKWKRTVTAFQYRICYNQWNGSKIDHDPIFGMESPAPLLLSYTVHNNGWLPSLAIGGVIAGVAVIILIVAIVVHRREK